MEVNLLIVEKNMRLQDAEKRGLFQTAKKKSFVGLYVPRAEGSDGAFVSGRISGGYDGNVQPRNITSISFPSFQLKILNYADGIEEGFKRSVIFPPKSGHWG